MRPVRALHKGAVVIACSMLVACTGLPARGPQSDSVEKISLNQEGDAPYVVVKLTAEMTPYLVGHVAEPLSGRLRSSSRQSSSVALGVGDVVAISIYESTQGGLFIPASNTSRVGNFVELPTQAVSRAGTISVPYAGEIPVTGLTIPDVQHMIISRLRMRAIEPQVIVSLRDQKSTQVSVLGEVNNPARMPANSAGERLLDVIARAGGPKYPGRESFVSVQRHGRQAKILFDQLVKNPDNNVYVEPGDMIYVTHEPRAAVVFGATDKNGQIKFDAENLSLADALAKSGGLADSAAEPSAVYIYRTEPRAQLVQMGVDVSRFKGKIVPTIYQVDLRDPSGFFQATQFPLRDKDLIYVANAKSVEIVKFLQFVRILTATIREPIRASTDVTSPPVLSQ